MRAARSTTTRDVELVELPDPVAGPGEVVCRVLACGVCGSDVSEAWVARKVPVVLGHELCGEVEQVGAGVSSVAVGDRVVIHHHVPCGECRRCRRGHETLCDTFRSTQLDPGGFAERVRIRAELVPELLPLDGLDDERGTFVEPLACVLRALDRLRLTGGESLLVVGAGTSGLLAIAAAHARAVDVVWVREPRPERMDVAISLGAERHGNELVDAVIVCTPDAEAIADGLKAVAPGGAICLYAPPAPGDRLTVDAYATYMGEIELVTSYSGGPGDMRAALELIRSGRVDPLPLVTHRLGLQDAAQALENQRTYTSIKTLVRLST